MAVSVTSPDAAVMDISQQTKWFKTVGIIGFGSAGEKNFPQNSDGFGTIRNFFKMFTL